MDNESMNVLLVEDDTVYATAVQESILRAGARAFNPSINVQWATNLTHAFDLLQQGPMEAVLLDLSLPDSRGIEGIRRLRQAHPDVPLVVLTGRDDDQLSVQALRAGAEDYLLKGEVNGRALVRALRYAMERHRFKALLRDLALTDDLTGLYNRRGLFTLAEHRMLLAHRTGQRVFLVFVDMDRLKQINDRFGHGEGSYALCRLADLLRHSFRQSDIVARLGGDEFVVFGTENTPGRADRAAERLAEQLEQYNQESSRGYNLSASIGVVAVTPDHTVSLEELLVEADERMYKVKEKKRQAPE